MKIITKSNKLFYFHFLNNLLLILFYFHQILLLLLLELFQTKIEKPISRNHC